MSRFAALLAVLLFSLGCEPIVMIPGGELSGSVKPIPADWTFSKDFDTVQLETRPDDPYSVNIWGVGIGPDFLIAAARPDGQWAQNIEANPNVRLRIGEDLFELRAVRAPIDQWREPFMKAAKAKYDGFEPDEEQAANAVLYRLVAR